VEALAVGLPMVVLVVLVEVVVTQLLVQVEQET
jgi:hypothetical protein